MRNNKSETIGKEGGHQAPASTAASTGHGPVRIPSHLSPEVRKVLIESLLVALKERACISEEDLPGILSNLATPADQEVPVSIFGSPTLSALEAITVHLKEKCHLRYSEIAAKLGRDQRTIWVTYSNARKKSSDQKDARSPAQRSAGKSANATSQSPSSLTVPLRLLSRKELTVLETVVVHMRDYYRLRHIEIGEILKRSPKDISAIYIKGKAALAA